MSDRFPGPIVTGDEDSLSPSASAEYPCNVSLSPSVTALPPNGGSMLPPDIPPVPEPSPVEGA